MKKIILITLIGLILITPKSHAQKDAAAAAVVGGLFAIGAGIAAVEAMKEQAELSATEWFLSNHPEFTKFSLKTLDFDGKKMRDLSNTSLITFRVVEFEITGSSKTLINGQGYINKGNLTLKNKFILFCFTSKGWINQYGINNEKIRWQLINTEEWIDMMVAYTKVASGFDEENRIRNVLENGKIINRGVKNTSEGNIDFYKMGGDMYLVSDFSPDMKIVYNEKSLGFYLKETKDLIQIKRGAIIKIHDFFMNTTKTL